ncbi:MAG: DUF1570 domain-containing protein [Phycisphaerae bacterium]|nr:DUF1570 domain-containing protein [Phycisphaerae bacterium]
MKHQTMSVGRCACAAWLLGAWIAAAPLGCTPPRPRTDGQATSTYRPGVDSTASTPIDGAASNTINPAILSREDWRYTTAEGEIIRTTHYRIFTTTKDKVIRVRLALFLEHALAHYRSAITPLPEPETKLDTYLMNNRPQWERITKQLMGQQAESLLKIPRGGYASRGFGVFYDIGLFDTLAIAGHEGWHQFTQKSFKESLPAWLEEGLATYMEGHRWEQNVPTFRPWANVQRFDQLRKAKNAGQLMSLDELLGSRPQDFLDVTDDRVLTFYAQLWALTHFLNEGQGGKYAAGLREAVSDAALGRLSETMSSRLGERAGSMMATRNGPGVFLAYFNSDVGAAGTEFAQFLDQLTQTGARGPVVEGASPFVKSGQ